MRPEREIGLGAAIPLKYLVSVLFTLLDGLDVLLSALALGAEALLGRAFRHLEVLSGQVGPAQLVHKLETLGLGLGVVLSAMVLEVVAVLA